MSRSEVNVEDITPGMVIYAAPGPLIVEDVLTTQSLSKQRKDKHPLLVLSVNAPAQSITVTYIASFKGATDLASVNMRGGSSAKKLFVPILPAIKEYDHDPVSWESHPKPIPAGWVSIRNKTTFTGEKFTTFNDEKYFSAETASIIDALITTLA
ncbi:hypothetical protein JR316_0010784 [Psilocybe cubensis]|uniref:Uncharacterized protein n=2 Tax=Psilocybe cubensis TaxID=181762 RepID=A0A8H7XXX7_PSICU|nr:hypothetical protein JR316_0010784 [Psilocybe cubensis]KAH9476868.1 hypothetical protein JR316_0010784 [Psilocybe cubensis]